MKKSSPFLLYSLIIHLGALLLGMFLWVEPLRPPLLPPDIDVEFFRVIRPETPPEPIKPPVNPPLASVVQEEKPAAPKPKPTLDMDWSVTETLPSSQRDAAPARPNKPSLTENLSHAPRPAPSVLDQRQTAGVATVNLPKVNRESTLEPPVSNPKIYVTDEKELDADSPNPELDELKYWHRRGRAIQGTQMGNASSGSGGGSAVATGMPIHLDMMNAIGREIAEAATTPEVDLVFIIDKTGSMRDNVRGIRAYVDAVFDRLTRAGRDTAVGLVTFGEVKISKLKARGVTTDHAKFKNWLRKVKIEGGGDLAESGLDAIVAAQSKIKFRRGAQRFFVFASDGSFHDADYDGKSKHSLDAVIVVLRRENIRVDVIGIDYLPVKQLAWGTGGRWRKIPGRGDGEYTPPITLTAKMLSEFGALNFKGDALNDELIVRVGSAPRPKWFTATWKVLNPLGERCHGPFTERQDIIDNSLKVVKFKPEIRYGRISDVEGNLHRYLPSRK